MIVRPPSRYGLYCGMTSAPVYSPAWVTVRRRGRSTAVGAAPVGRDRHHHVGLPRRLEQVFNVLHRVIVLDALADDLPVDPAWAEKVHLGIGDRQSCALVLDPEAHGM